MINKEESNISVNCSGIISFLIFLVFFTAKIFDKIDWSWWWVFSPLWIPALICLIILIVLVIFKIWAR